MRQILINLLGNSVKFTDRGQTSLKVEQSGQRYAFSVEDTGPGITEEAQTCIFEPFQQAEEGEAMGGTGLGLAITRRHIELMGGSLSLESIPGEGACFRFELELPPAGGELVLKGEQKGRLAGSRNPAGSGPWWWTMWRTIANYSVGSWNAPVSK